MKKMILATLLVLSNVAFAQMKEGKVATYGEARKFVEERAEYKAYNEAVRSGKMTDKIKVSMQKFLIESASTVKGVDATGLESLTAVRPEATVKIVELITIAKNGSAEQKTKALNDLRIMSEGAKLIDSSATTAKEEAQALENIANMADYNENAKNFKTELAKELKKGGISISQAIEKASKGKITLEKIKDCVI